MTENQETKKHDDAVDGSFEIRPTKPVEAGSWNPIYFKGFYTIPRWLFGISEPSTVSQWAPWFSESWLVNVKVLFNQLFDEKSYPVKTRDLRL